MGKWEKMGEGWGVNVGKGGLGQRLFLGALGGEKEPEVRKKMTTRAAAEESGVWENYWS